MKLINELHTTLKKIDGKGYKAYKDIQDNYTTEHYDLFIDHVQGDPFAEASRIRVRVNKKDSLFPEEFYCTKSREIAFRDYITREFHKAIKKYSKGIRGSGKSGMIMIDCPGQEILNKTSVLILDKTIEVRFRMGLPAEGRKIAGRISECMFFSELPDIIKNSLFFIKNKKNEIENHIFTAEDNDFIREHLRDYNIVSFIADESILPRKSGIEQLPMNYAKAVKFTSPDELRVTFDLPNKGRITGMGIPGGITLIAGGGYHGKSTLLKTIELGIYNHIPGDGRELCATEKTAFKIRAEDGRRIEKTCITPFISNLPLSQNTDSFSTDDASGSTSQAANIIESIETEASLILIDEDTSATNFMIRDHRMQELVSKDKEPITPFIDRVKQLKSEKNISTILVMGGSGDYFDVADNVICMYEFRPVIKTTEAKEIAARYRSERKIETAGLFGKTVERIPDPASLDPSRGNRKIKINTIGTKTILFGNNEIDISQIEQIVHPSQLKSIGDAIVFAKKFMNKKRTLNEIILLTVDEIEKKGLDVLSSSLSGEYSSFRSLELAAAINRLRTFSVKQEI